MVPHVDLHAVAGALEAVLERCVVLLAGDMSVGHGERRDAAGVFWAAGGVGRDGDCVLSEVRKRHEPVWRRR